MSTIATTSQPATFSPLKRLIQHHPLVAYFVLAFVGSWLTELPVVLGKNGIGLLPYTLPFLPFFLLMPFTGPTLSAFVVTAVTDGRAGVWQLLRRYVQWRVGVRWYLLALLGAPVVLLLSTSVVLNAAPLSALVQQWPLIFTSYLPSVLLITLVLGGPLGEEPGWRGFALPRLQQQYGALRGSLMLGTLHALWHLPLFLVVGAYAPFTLPGFVAFALVVMLNAFIFTWVFNNTRGSLLIVILLHSAFNAGSNFVEQLVPSSQLSNWFPVITYAVCVVLIIVFTRGHLGYRSEQAPQLVEAPRPVETPLAQV